MKGHIRAGAPASILLLLIATASLKGGVDPTMNIVNFKDDHGNTIGPNVAQDLLVSPNHQRSFDFLVSDGLVQSFTFTYTHEAEIQPAGFVLQGIAADGFTPTGPPLNLPAPGGNPFTYSMDPATIAALFTRPLGTPLVFGERIHVIENFAVIQCSPTPDNDGTDFSITWVCASSPNPACDTDTTRRFIKVATSLGGMTPSLSISPPLDICGATPSELVLKFINSTHDANRITGSAMKTLHRIEFSMNQDALTFGGIFLEGSGTGTPSVNVSTIPGFYTYFGSPQYRVVLNFDVLTANLQSNPRPLGANGPLVNGFIPEGGANPNDDIYNEIVESGFVALRFAGARFHCQDAKSYAGSGFEDCPKPSGGTMFFGKNGSDLFKFFYDDMCHANSQPQGAIYLNLANNFPVTGFAESDVTDVQLGDHAVMDFYYQYSGVGTPSPFLFSGAYSGTPYFTCQNLKYQAVIAIPDLYQLNNAKYNTDPNGGPGPAIAILPTPQHIGSDNVYTFTGLDFHGRITIDVTLIDCPFNTGGFDDFEVKIQALCNDCCPYTITCYSTALYHHCQGFCPGPPQSTLNFAFNRNTFGWTDASMNTPATPGSGISLNRAYNCDQILVTSDGSIVPQPATTGLAFRIDYVPGVSYQFFEYVLGSGRLDYTVNGGTTLQHTIVPADLAGTFLGSGGWPASVNAAGGSCSLWINFPPAVLAAINASSTPVTLSLRMFLRVKPMTSAPAPGFYNLPQVRAQFYSNFGESCDSWGDNMMVLNVRTTHSFVIRNANDADQSLGWPFNTGVCERHFLFRTFVSGGLTAIDDFPAEFRPIVQWPSGNDLSMTLPAGVHFDSAYFTVFGRAGWNSPTGYPVDVSQAGQQITFLTYDIPNGPQNQSWPLLDKDGGSIDMYLRGWLINDCPATPANPIATTSLNLPFISQFYSPDPACRLVPPTIQQNPPATDILNYPPAPATTISLTSAANPYHVTSTPTSITGIDYAFLGWGNSRIQNAWIRVTSAGLTVTGVHKNGGGVIQADANGYFPLGVIVSGTLNAAHLTLDVALNGCSPGMNVPVTIEYGYSCIGYPTAYPPPASESCVKQTYTFDVLPEATGMSMLVTPPPVTTGNPCDLYRYTVRITSTQLADLEQPRLTVTLPGGMSFASATYLTSGGASGTLTIPVPTLNDYAFNVNQAYGNNGIPPTPSYVDLQLTVTGTCSSAGSNPSPIVFHSIGKNICGGDVTFPDQTETLLLTQLPKVTSCPADAVIECPATPVFGTPVFTSACDPTLTVTMVDTTLPATCPAVSVLKRTWTASDDCGNAVSCSQTITVRDTTNPTVTSTPADTVIESPALPVFGTPVFADNCDPNLTVTMADSTLPAVCPAVSVVRRTWTARDTCGGSVTCSQTITVQDTTSPTVTSCPADATIECPATLAFGTPIFADAGAKALRVSAVDTTLPAICPALSVTRRTWTATDDCGGSVSCSQTITVQDTIAPTIITCPASRTLFSEFQCLAAIPDLTGEVLASADCSGVTVTQDPAPASSYGPGTHAVVLTACDGCSNCTTCTTFVTVLTPVAMDCPADLVVEHTSAAGAVVNYSVPAATSPCCSPATVTCSILPGQFPIGATPVLCTATDLCGNSKSCSFTVTVNNTPSQLGKCSFTQGFYGNAKGKFNGTPSLALIGNLLAPGPLVLGKTTWRSLSIQPGSAGLLQQRLPAGGAPAALPNSGNQVLQSAVLPLNAKGRFDNILLGQTITLSLNARLDPQLLSVGLTPSFCTAGTLPGPDGLRGTADDGPVSSDLLMFNIPGSVLSALIDPGLNINDTTVQGLLELANRALAGLPTAGASLSEINQGVDAINRGFDECRVRVDCSTGMVILDSFNDTFSNRPDLGSGGGGGGAIHAAAAANGPGNVQVRVSNIDATKEPSEPDHAGNPGGKSLWWRWRAPTSAPVLLQTAGSSFDSLLAVYSGTTVSNLVLVASNDDSANGLFAETTFLAEVGTEYQIAVDGFDAAAGTVVLSLVVQRPLLCLPVVRVGDQVELCVAGQVGGLYTVEASSDLAAWTPIATLRNEDSTLRFLDPIASQRFYRLILEFETRPR